MLQLVQFWAAKVSKLSICTSALHRQEQSNWGVRLTQDAYFSLWTHTKQLLLVTFCHMPAKNGANFWTHGRQTNGWTAEDGRTDRRGRWNSYLDTTHIYEYILPTLWIKVYIHTRLVWFSLNSNTDGTVVDGLDSTETGIHSVLVNQVHL